MSRILFLESVSGVAGDMFAAAFVDAGLVTAAELAARAGAPDRAEAAFKILERLAANRGSGVRKRARARVVESTFRLA